MNHDTLYARLHRYGYTDDEATNCPPGTPRWAYRAEQALQQPLVDHLRECADSGVTLGEVARALGVPWGTLRHYAARRGVLFPRRNGYKQVAGYN